MGLSANETYQGVSTAAPMVALNPSYTSWMRTSAPASLINGR